MLDKTYIIFYYDIVICYDLKEKKNFVFHLGSKTERAATGTTDLSLLFILFSSEMYIPRSLVPERSTIELLIIFELIYGSPRINELDNICLLFCKLFL